MNFRVLSLVVAALLAGACAPLPPKIQIQPFGEVSVEKERALAEQAALIKDASEVRVISGQLPDGLMLAEQSSKIIVAPGYEQIYIPVGTVEADFIKGFSQFRSWLWTYDYKEDWHQNYCLVQAPFKLVTLGLWSLVPFAWPCIAKAPSDELERKEYLINELKRATKAAGGNLLVLIGSTDLHVTNYNQYGDNLGTTVASTVGLRGFAIKANK
jgi:hypothetical protein